LFDTSGGELGRRWISRGDIRKWMLGMLIGDGNENDVLRLRWRLPNMGPQIGHVFGTDYPLHQQ
jgi:hypothetical protein